MDKAIIHVLTPIIAACILNAYIYAKGWNSEAKKPKYRSKCIDPKPVQNNYIPPGYVIAIIWIVILGLLGYTHFLLYPSYASLVVVLSILYCLAYPFLTSGLQATNSDIYNGLSFVLATVVFIMGYIQKPDTILFTSPFLLWTSYVNIVT